jgi:tRNA (Thr-GGU) A37 N-methylase
MSESEYSLHPIGVIRSPLRNRKDAPKQGDEGAPDAWLEISSQVADGLHGIAAGDEIIVITWGLLHCPNQSPGASGLSVGRGRREPRVFRAV